MKLNIRYAAWSLMIAAMGVAAQAAPIAHDSASDIAYAPGWTTGTNGGYGFGAWTLEQNDGSGVGGTATVMVGSDIPSGGLAWALGSDLPTVYYNWYGMKASRELSAPLTPLMKFSADLDHGVIPENVPGGGITFSFHNAAMDEVASIWVYQSAWYGTAPNYRMAEGPDTGVPLTTNGLHLTLSPISDTTYAMTLTPLGGSTTGLYRTFKNSGLGPITGITLTAYNNGPGNEFFVNNLEVNAVPEPMSIAVLGIGLAAFLRRRR